MATAVLCNSFKDNNNKMKGFRSMLNSLGIDHIQWFQRIYHNVTFIAQYGIEILYNLTMKRKTDLRTLVQLEAHMKSFQFFMCQMIEEAKQLNDDEDLDEFTRGKTMDNYTIDTLTEGEHDSKSGHDLQRKENKRPRE